MALLVTGASGFVGGQLVRALLEKKEQLVNSFGSDEIKVLIRPGSPRRKNVEGLKVKVCEGDITDLASLDRAMEEVSLIFHCAANVDDWASKKMLWKTNVDGIMKLLEAFRRAEDAKTFVDLSSSGIYGLKLPKHPVNEDFPKKPHSNYQKSKWAAEQFLWQFSEEYGIQATAIRTPSITGIGDTVQLLKVCEALKEEKFPLIGSGNNKLSYTNVLDLVRAMIMVAENPAKSKGEAFNVTSFIVTLKEFQDILLELLGLEHLKPRKLPYSLTFALAFLSEGYAAVRRKQTTLNRYRVIRFSRSRLYDSSKIKDVLGFEPEYGPRETFEQGITWLKEKMYL